MGDPDLEESKMLGISNLTIGSVNSGRLVRPNYTGLPNYWIHLDIIVASNFDSEFKHQTL